jgi:hypothetical protein
MDHAPDLGEAAIQEEMRRRVGRRPQLALDNPAILQRDHHQILRPQLVVWHAARFDYENADFAVDAAGIAERESHETGTNERLVRAPDLLSQLRK